MLESLKQGGTGNTLILTFHTLAVHGLAVHGLAVHGALIAEVSYTMRVVSKSVLDTLHSTKKCPKYYIGSEVSC